LPGWSPPATPPVRNHNNKILILGAMAELGEESLAEHQGIVDLKANIHGRKWYGGGDFQKRIILTADLTIARGRSMAA